MKNITKSLAVLFHRMRCAKIKLPLCIQAGMGRPSHNVKTLIPAGKIIAHAKIDSDSALEHVSVDSLFQRQGIGTQLIKFINDSDKQFYVYAGTEHISRYRLTHEGAKLIQACQRAGILKEEQIILDVPMSPSSSCSYRSRR